jgi:hypothetical protein
MSAEMQGKQHDWASARVDAPAQVEAPSDLAHHGELSFRHRLVYRSVALLLVLYFALWVVFAALFEPNLQFYSYYAVNYDHGFVRRGLAGEIADVFPPELYFTGLLFLRWVVPVLFATAVAGMVWRIGVRSGWFERRVMLALLLPMLPFGIVRAIVLPTPDLLGEAVLAAFAVVLLRCRTDRSVILASASYGAMTALLTLVHEAIPLLQALGAVLAIVVLVPRPIRVQRFGALTAVAPGAIVALFMALVGRSNASAHCDSLPRRPVEFPILLSPGQIFKGEQAYTDYHDWTCRFITVTTRNTPIGSFDQVGWAPWVSSTITGVVIVAVTLILMRVVAAVPFAHVLRAMQGRRLWALISILMLLPVFATSSDWARWWTAISFDVGIVYALFASRHPGSRQPANRRTRVGFAAALVGLALFPAVIGAGAAIMVQPLLAQCDELSNNPQWVGICP